MSSDDVGDKTELPTERRREQSRERGDVARSADLTAAAGILTATSALYFLGGGIATSMVVFLKSSFSADPWIRLDEHDLVKITWQVSAQLASMTLPVMITMLVSGMLVSFAQVGVIITTETLAPNIERLNPLNGFQRIFSLQAVARLVASLLKLLFVGPIAFLYMSVRFPRFLEIGQFDVGQIWLVSGSAILELGFFLALAILMLAILDYGFQYWKHEQDLMMTKEEIREEFKEMEGNPQYKSRRKEAHRKLAQARDLAAVRTADMVITNPTEIAVAIKYDPTRAPAPIVVAKGLGEMAAQIRRLAAENGVPIIERKPLARTLYYGVKVGRVIPSDLYDVFVELLAYVYRITGRKPPVAA